MSGFYFNKHDIRFQIILKILLLTHMEDLGQFSKFILYKNYKKKNINSAYFLKIVIQNQIYFKKN